MSESPPTAPYPIAVGIGTSHGIATGTARWLEATVDQTITCDSDLSVVESGDIIVCEELFDPFYEAAKRAVGIVRSGPLPVQNPLVGKCAVVARDLGIPAVSDYPEAKTAIDDGERITIDGRGGYAYAGVVEPHRIR